VFSFGRDDHIGAGFLPFVSSIQDSSVCRASVRAQQRSRQTLFVRRSHVESGRTNQEHPKRAAHRTNNAPNNGSTKARHFLRVRSATPALGRQIQSVLETVNLSPVLTKNLAGNNSRQRALFLFLLLGKDPIKSEAKRETVFSSCSQVLRNC
jgi:hypothetical protein